MTSFVPGTSRTKRLSGKAKEEATDLKKKVEDLEKDRDAKQKVAQERNDQIAALKEELIVATSSAIADVEVKKMKKNANNREIIDEKCRDAVFAVANLAAFGASVLADDENSEETAAYVHERISSAVPGAWLRISSPPGSTWILRRSLCRISAQMRAGNLSPKRTIRNQPTREPPCLPHLHQNSFAL